MPTIPVMAVTIELGDAVPDLNAAQPALKSGIANLANTPPATGALVPPQSPSGSVTGQAATFNYTNTITSTKKYTAAMVAAQANSTSFNFTTAVTPGSAPLGSSVGLKEDLQTTPSAPTGSYSQVGVAAISNTAAVILTGLTASGTSFYKWQ